MKFREVNRKNGDENGKFVPQKLTLGEEYASLLAGVENQCGWNILTIFYWNNMTTDLDCLEIGSMG